MNKLPETGAAVKPSVFHNAAEHYRFVNSLWPDQLPKLDGSEAISAAKRLWRVATGKPWKGKWLLTSGNRYSAYPGWHGFPVNPDKGWERLVHDISHSAHRQISRTKPHSGTHAMIEAELIRYVIEHGWLDGKLKSKAKPKTKHWSTHQSLGDQGQTGRYRSPQAPHRATLAPQNQAIVYT